MSTKELLRVVLQWLGLGLIVVGCNVCGPYHLAAQEEAEWRFIPHVDPESLADIYLRWSIQVTPEIKEYLVNERGLLHLEQFRLMNEIAKLEKIGIPSADWDATYWMYAARVFERYGKLDANKKSLQEALRQLANSTEYDYLKNMILQNIATGLAQVGDLEDAKKAAMAISLADSKDLHVTARGPVNVEPASHRSYGLLLVVAMAKEPDDPTGSVTHMSAIRDIIESIPDPITKAAAYGVLALQQMEKGDLPGALQSVDLARKCEPKSMVGSEAKVLEFTMDGPNPVAYHFYVAIVLERIALHQAFIGDDAAAVAMVDQVTPESVQASVREALALAFASRGRLEDAKRWIDRIDDQKLREEVVFRATWSCIISQNFEGVTRLYDRITAPKLRAEIQLMYADYLQRFGDRERARTEREWAKTLIESLRPGNAELLTMLSRIEIVARDYPNARQSLFAAAKLAQEITDTKVKTRALADIAAELFRAGAIEESVGLMRNVADMTRRLSIFEQGNVAIHVIQTQLSLGMLQPAERLAREISDASFRCQALGAVAEKYYEGGEIDTGRKLFAEAYRESVKVVNSGRLNTPDSVGGSIRLLARRQAACDLSGLESYLEKCETPTIRAYGYLGAAEFLVPEAVKSAEARGQPFPQGLFQKFWNQREIVQMANRD